MEEDCSGMLHHDAVIIRPTTTMLWKTFRQGFVWTERYTHNGRWHYMRADLRWNQDLFTVSLNRLQEKLFSSSNTHGSVNVEFYKWPCSNSRKSAHPFSWCRWPLSQGSSWQSLGKLMARGRAKVAMESVRVSWICLILELGDPGFCYQIPGGISWMNQIRPPDANQSWEVLKV